MSYGPPVSDIESEDEFEIYFTGEGKSKQTYEPSYEDQINDALYEAVTSGDLNKVKDLRKEHSQYYSIDVPLRQGWSLLQYACYHGHLLIVQYLLEAGADVNRQIDGMTPFILACDCEKPEEALGIVTYLLKHGAFINVADRSGTTPMMLAIKRGLYNVANLIIKQVSLEAADMQGRTALFYAVEYNQFEIVQLLLQNGADTEVTNKNCLTPKQQAEELGFLKLVELFPIEKEVYITPSEYRHYSNYEDIAPTIFKNDRSPDYFQEINPLLYGMRMDKFLGLFAKANISLQEFLTINDTRLEEIGITFPFQRKRIHLGLMKFHGYPWHKSSIPKVNPNKYEDLFDMYLIMCGHLKHFIILNSTLKYVTTNEYISIHQDLESHTINRLLGLIQGVKKNVVALENSIKYIRSFNPPEPVLQVNTKKLEKTRYQNFLCFFRKPYISYFSIFGCSAVIIWACIRIKIDHKQNLMNWIDVLGKLKLKPF